MISITYLLLSNSKRFSMLWTIYIHWIHVQFFTWGCGYTHIRDSWFVPIHKNSLSIEWIRMTNDKCKLYEFSFHTIRELHTNHELRITNTRIRWPHSGCRFV